MLFAVLFVLNWGFEMVIDEAKLKMDNAISHLKSELAQIRTGRATPALIEKVVVDVYGGSQHLTVEELGQILVHDSQHLVVTPWDKSIVEEIAQGLIKANLGFRVVVDNDVIRLTLPSLTEERRKELIKLMHSKLEKYRIEIRQIRQDAREKLKLMKELGELGEDEERRLENELQELHDEYIELIEMAGKAKEEQLLEV